ncbi:MAG: hypothetical protein ACREFR_05610, partial [Limisphaerales bacterium]
MASQSEKNTDDITQNLTSRAGRMRNVASEFFTGSSNDNLGDWTNSFVFSSGCILLTTGMAKIISAFGHQQLLRLDDPLFAISFRHLMLLAGLVEVTISTVCFLSSKKRLSLALIAWVATGFLVYRCGVHFAGWTRPCPCMGTFLGTLHISQVAGDVLAGILFIYLLAGSYFLMAFTMKQNILKR